MKSIIAVILFACSFIGIVSGCQKKEDKALHFGPSPGGGKANDAEAEELHYGPSPGNKHSGKNADESLHFGPSPGSGFSD